MWACDLPPLHNVGDKEILVETSSKVAHHYKRTELRNCRHLVECATLFDAPTTLFYAAIAQRGGPDNL